MSVFEQVRQITALEAAERLGLKLKKAGSKHWACCPLHGEKTASLCIYGDGTWYCFGCHKGGDAVRLYQEMFGLDAKDAALRLAEDFGIRVDISIHAPPRGATKRPRKGKEEKNISIHAPPRGATVALCQGGLRRAISIHAPPRGATYLNKHGIDGELFQFTPLREGRLEPGEEEAVPAQFQFTPLREGRPASP